MRRKVLLTSLVFALSLATLYAQDSGNYSFYTKGIVGQGSGRVKGIDNNSMWGVAIGVSKDLSNSNDEWTRIINAKAVNIGVIYNNFENIKAPYSFGQSIGVQAELEIGVLENDKFRLRVAPGFGLGYMTKTTFTHPETYIFGTRINGLFTANLKSSYAISNKLETLAEIGFTHYSNGSFKIPNAGINTINASLGIKYNLNHPLIKEDSVVLKRIPYRNHGLDLMAGVGQRGKYKEHKGFFRMGLYGGYSYFFNTTLGIRTGIDAVYYKDVYDPAVYDDTVPYWGRSYDHWRLGLSVGGEMKMNKIAVTGNLGYYLHMDSPTGQKMYWNAAVKYYITPKFGIQATLNAHKFQADYVNWGVFVRL